MGQALAQKLVHLIKVFPEGSIAQTRYLCLPVAILLSIVALATSPLEIPVRIFWYSLGLLSWTFLEYLLHRWVLHYQPKSAPGQAFIDRLHATHHHDPADESQVCMPLALTLPLWMIFLTALILFGGGHSASFLVTSGVAVMMVLYDMVHFATHYQKATTSYGKFLKKNHMKHHFANHHVRFGVTSPIWDYVFRTHR